MVKTIKAHVLLITGLDDILDSKEDRALENRICRAIVSAYKADAPVFTFPNSNYSDHLRGLIGRNKILTDHFDCNETILDYHSDCNQPNLGNETDIDKIHSYLDWWHHKEISSYARANVRVGGSCFSYRGKWSNELLVQKNQDLLLEVWDACVPHICCLGNCGDVGTFFVDPLITLRSQRFPYNPGDRTEVPKNSLYKYVGKIDSENVFQRLDDVRFSF